MPGGSSIIICGQKFDVGRKVVTFEDDPNFSAYTMHRTDKPSEIYPFAPAKGLGQQAARYRPRRIIGNDRSLDTLRKVIKQFVVHHDGMFDSKGCFHVLHNERGLSVHFLIDNDGTIYQTLDLVDCGFQAAGVNEISVGVELANRGDALRFPHDYDNGKHGKRDKVTCTINSYQFLAYSYTTDQYDAMQAIGKTLARVFPSLPQAYPMGADGEPLWVSLESPREYSGYLGHYHVTNQKWDPGPFDFKSFATGIRARMFFPVVFGNDKHEMPMDVDKVRDLADQFYENNETEGEGGYFPVGPWGEHKLWHGGVHIRVDRGTEVRAPFAGKVVAARMRSWSDIQVGSTNFVLIKHEPVVGTKQVTFWTLYYHLDEETPDAPGTKDPKAPNWYNKIASQMTDDAIGITKGIDIAAGELIGHVGEAGPPGRMTEQIHLEVMSAVNLGEDVHSGFWKPIDGASMGRFCTVQEVTEKIDKPQPKRDGKFSRQELLAFYRSNPARTDFRKMAVRHLSEWANNNDWEIAINRATDFATLNKIQKNQLFRDQIEPSLWWNDEVADAAGLPGDKIVWNYHPITFLLWIHDQQNKARSVAKGIAAGNTFGGKPPPSFLKDDGEALDGFMDDEDLLFGEASKHLELEDLAKGYPDEK